MRIIFWRVTALVEGVEFAGERRSTVVKCARWLKWYVKEVRAVEVDEEDGMAWRRRSRRGRVVKRWWDVETSVCAIVESGNAMNCWYVVAVKGSCGTEYATVGPFLPSASIFRISASLALILWRTTACVGVALILSRKLQSTLTVVGSAKSLG